MSEKGLGGQRAGSMVRKMEVRSRVLQCSRDHSVFGFHDL